MDPFISIHIQPPSATLLSPCFRIRPCHGTSEKSIHRCYHGVTTAEGTEGSQPQKHSDRKTTKPPNRPTTASHANRSESSPPSFRLPRAPPTSWSSPSPSRNSEPVDLECQRNVATAERVWRRRVWPFGRAFLVRQGERWRAATRGRHIKTPPSS